MSIFRAYSQPGPDAQPLLHVRGMPARKYSEALRAECEVGSEDRVPLAPPSCPICHVYTDYWSRLCFMETVAGAYLFIVSW